MKPFLGQDMSRSERAGRLHEAKLTRRRALLAAAAVAGASAGIPVTSLARQATPIASPVAARRDWRGEHWVGTWAASPHIPSLGMEDVFPSQRFEFDDQTVRQIVRVSVGGDLVRIRLSNAFGDVPLVIAAAHLARRDAEARIDAASDRVLTFSGNPAVTIPPGALALSDPVELSTPALSELAISLYLPQPTTSTTVHGMALQTNYFSPEGDFTGEPDLPVEATAQTWVFLSGVDVAVSAPMGVVVALGDSITDGVGSTPDTNQRWPDFLAERLVGDANQGATAVLNEGIIGNRVLRDSPPDIGFGPSALARFDRDVLAQAGVTHLIVYLGINDIGLPAAFGMTDEVVNADELIAGLRQIAERAHERGIAIFGVPITPYEGSMIFSPEGEATRQTVNDWIRTGGAYDAVIDFDAVVRDPSKPSTLLPAFDAGDKIHVNDAGYKTMADSIDLALFRTNDDG